MLWVWVKRRVGQQAIAHCRVAVFPILLTIPHPLSQHRRLQSVVLTRRTKETHGHFLEFIFHSLPISRQCDSPPAWGQYPQYNISCWSSRSSAVKNVCQYFSSIHYGEEKPAWDINTAEFMVGHFRAMTTEEAFLFTQRHWVISLASGIEQELTLYAILMHVLDKLFSFLLIFSSVRNAVEQLKVSFR